jgi:acyl-coenzyme A synthetase/AMP-(fatty) acid ligase
VVAADGARLINGGVPTVINLPDLHASRVVHHAPLQVPPPRALAYIVFTSGSSGPPKGVMIERAALGNTVREAVRAYGLGARDRMLQFSDLSFDAAFEEIFPVWAVGGAVVVRRPETASSAASFWTFCVENAVTVVDLTPAFWQLLVPIAVADPASVGDVRLVILGGDRLPPSAVAVWQATIELAERCWLATSYGPTEATIIVTAGPAGPAVTHDGLAEEIPIGQRIGGIDLRVASTSAELCISGVNLARGYLDDPRSTAERFRPDPHGRVGDRVYLSGDVARTTPDGRITIHGRLDRQVKVRGYRVDLGEVERELLRLPTVEASGACVADADGGTKALVAYVTGPDPSSTPDLIRSLRLRLPAYAVPERVVVLDRLPLNDRGKVDYVLLADDARWRVAAVAGSAPRTVLAIMREMLGRPDLSDGDNFFDAGGHSILSLRLMARLADEFGTEIDLLQFFFEPTAAGVQSQIDHHGKGAAGDGAQ